MPDDIVMLVVLLHLKVYLTLNPFIVRGSALEILGVGKAQTMNGHHESARVRWEVMSCIEV